MPNPTRPVVAGIVGVGVGVAVSVGVGVGVGHLAPRHGLGVLVFEAAGAGAFDALRGAPITTEVPRRPNRRARARLAVARREVTVI